MRPKARGNSDLDHKDQVPAGGPRLVLLGLGTLALFYVCYRLAVPFVPALAWAVALAIVAYPCHRFLARKLASPDLAAGISVTMVLVFLIVPSIFLTRQVLGEARQAAEALRENDVRDAILAAIDRTPVFRDLFACAEDSFDMDDVRGVIASRVGTVTGLLEGSLWALIQAMTMVFLLFYFFRDGRTFMAGLREFSPLTPPEVERLSSRVSDSIYATIYGTFVTGLVQGVSGGLIFWALGLPAPVFWGAIMFLFGVLPLVGGVLVWAPAAVYLVMSDRFGAAALLVGWGILMAGPVGNFLYGRCAGGRMSMHPVPTLLAYLGGLAVFGATGMVLGPVILALTLGLIDVWKGRMVPEQAPLHEAEEMVPELVSGIRR